MKKRIVIFTLIGILACTMLSACGKKKEEDKSGEATTTVSSEEQAGQKDTEDAKDAEAAESEAAESEAAESEAAESEAAEIETAGGEAPDQNASGALEEADQPQVILQDNGDATITVPEGQALGGD